MKAFGDMKVEQPRSGLRKLCGERTALVDEKGSK
jgi:hypothetical protein